MILSKNKVERRMGELGITQKDLAWRMGVAASSLSYTLSSIRAGKELRPSTAQNLANALEISVEALFGRKRAAA